jgi:phosphatidylglycerophosphatase A
VSAADRLANVLATWFGCGRSPRAPGTVGSLGAVPLHFALCRLDPWLHAVGVLGTIGVGIWAAQRYATERGEIDPQSVVIDEVAGTVIALGFVRGQSLWHALAAFLLFRLFDIWKPGVIRRVEHLSPVGLGIMADDLLAGLLAGVLAFGPVHWFLS